MRKLTVKNFSVIKDAELEFGKITVLIGPQSGGKSLLCKLAYFISAELPALTVNSASTGQPWSVFESLTIQKFREWFPPEGWGREPLQIEFRTNSYAVSFSGSQHDIEAPWFHVEFSPEFVEVYSNLTQESKQFDPSGPPQLQRDKERAWGEIMRLLDPVLIDMPTFIPASRALFVNTATGFAALSNPDIDHTIRLFAQEISWNSAQWKIGTLSSGRGVTQQIGEEFKRIARGYVVVHGSRPEFQADDSRVLPLTFLSSGTQELLPLFNVLERQFYWQEHRVVYNEGVRGFQNMPTSPGETRPLMYVEEPETHIFPSTQFELVKLFAWLSSDPVLRFSWVITTHSPYILSAFNNLIEAGQVAQAKPELKDEVAKVIPEKYWVNSDDFRAYSIHDGHLESIMDRETGLISANYLDQVSETIGMEFDELLRLGYVES